MNMTLDIITTYKLHFTHVNYLNLQILRLNKMKF